MLASYERFLKILFQWVNCLFKMNIAVIKKKQNKKNFVSKEKHFVIFFSYAIEILTIMDPKIR